MMKEGGRKERGRTGGRNKRKKKGYIKGNKEENLKTAQRRLSSSQRLNILRSPFLSRNWNLSVSSTLQAGPCLGRCRGEQPPLALIVATCVQSQEITEQPPHWYDWPTEVLERCSLFVMRIL